MKKIIASFILLGILIPFLPFNSAASGLPDIDVEITYVFDEGNPEVPANMAGQAYGSTINPTPISQPGYTFKYWIVNGVVRDDLPENHSFYVTSSLNLIGVYSPDDENVVLFIDSNGKILDTQFVADQGTAVAPTDNLPTKPGLQIATPAWVNKLTGTSDLTITDDSIFILQYESASVDTFDLTVDSVLEGTYDFNEVVTLTAAANDGVNDFSHWEENGIVVSRDLEYSFTMLSERSLDKVYLASPEADEALVSMTNDLTLRDGYQTYMGQFYLPSGADLVEYGFLIHSDNTLDLTLETEGVTIAKSNNYNSATNEFLTSFPVGSHMNVKAYVVYDDGTVKDVYSDNEARYILESEVLYETGFETSTSKTSYATDLITSDGRDWELSEAVRGNLAADKTSDNWSIRGRAAGYAEIVLPFTNLTQIDFQFAHYGTLDEGILSLEISNDDGISWIEVWVMDTAVYNNLEDVSIILNYNDLTGIEITDSLLVRWIFDGPVGNDSRMNLDNVSLISSSLYSDESHLVTMNDEGSIDRVLVKDNGYLPDEYNLEKEGYTFDGWYLEDTFSTPFDIETDTVTSDITLYAKWSINQYTITFDSNGGSTVDPITDDFGANIAPPTNPTKAGYIFDDWYLDAGLTEPVVDYTIPSQDVTVYAGWDLITYDITYVMDGGTNNISNPATYTIETPTITLQNPEKSGYTFDGWFTDAGLTTEISEITLGTYGHITLYAGFTEIVGTSYTVTFDSNEGSSVSSQTVPENDFATEPVVAPTREGYSFDGWFTDDTTFNSSFDFESTAITGDITLYAKWNQVYVETFDNSNATSSYADNSFVGDNSVTWTYVESRDENGDANNSGIDGKALMLRRISDNSSITSSTISGGISYFEVKIYKGFTGGGDRQIEVLINGLSIGTSTPFDGDDEHILIIENLNISGDFTIEIRNITTKQVIIDDITWISNSGSTEVATSYTVSYESNGGSTVASESVQEGQLASEPDVPTRSNYSFEGWFTDDLTFNNQFDFLTDTITDDITLYAKWVEDSSPETTVTTTITYSDTNMTSSYTSSSFTFEDISYEYNKAGSFDGGTSIQFNGSWFKNTTSLGNIQEIILTFDSSASSNTINLYAGQDTGGIEINPGASGLVRIYDFSGGEYSYFYLNAPSYVRIISIEITYIPE
jgi:uncharacterized repeat protein (TIGR02543 family)